MNYQLHYNLLIARATDRAWTKKSAPCYVEKHHIIPKCMGGINLRDNLVYLTYHEHCVAHLLLVKIYPNEIKLIYAAKRMYNNTQFYRRIIPKKAAEWLRVKHAAAVSYQFKGKKKGPFSAEHIKNLSIAHIGIKDTEETKLKKSVSAKKIVLSVVKLESKKTKLRAARLIQTNGGDKKVSILGIEYSSIGKAETATGINRFNIWRRLNLSKYNDYFYLET